MWARSLAAALLGLPLTVGAVGLAALLWPGPLAGHTLFMLLCSFVVWVGALALPFAMRSAARAWWTMGLCTLLSFGAMHGLKALGWVGVGA